MINQLVEQFREEGYAVWEGAFDADEVARMQGEADRILELIINSSIVMERKSGRLDIRQSPEGHQLVRKIQPIKDLSLYLSEISGDDRLIGPLRAIMGEEPVLMEEKLNYKEPLPEPIEGIEMPVIDDRFPVHSDWAYYKAQDYPQTIVSSAISFDDSNETSGPLRVWPGSHKQDRSHERMDDGLEVSDGSIDFDGGIDILAPAGSVMFFHSLLIHNSKPNVSGLPRRIAIYSHYPESAEMGFDVRNGPTRLSESPYEWEYERKKAGGCVQDVFKAPTFEDATA